ncbi:tetratricopeptide repeat protein [Bernardetia sp.]|uniref:tetratricopeptide repeat protein n=1 Tax=Bernardetia sp. TaxID=1937974 RepID=UPI0025C35D26|nr:tetratricopeptide repeat protein [Bernardetia sp.]
MKPNSIHRLIDELLDRLAVYRKEHVISSHISYKYELEKRIEDLETKINFLRELPVEEQNEISREELEKLLASLPLNFNEFEWQRFENAGININIIINQIEEKKINRILTELPNNEKFEGREKELTEIREKISVHKSVSIVSINGIGGIGKSALSKAFFLEHYKKYDYCLFLKGQSNIHDTLNNYTLLENLGISEKVNAVPPQTPNRQEKIFEMIKSELSNLEGKKLLLIDDASPNAHLLKNLTSAGWEILTTSRQHIDFMESFELLQATPKDAVAIFCVYYGKSIDSFDETIQEQVRNIVNRLAYHPLAIELVAKNIKRKNWTFEETNQKLAEKGLNIDNHTKLTTEHSGEQRIKDIFEYLLEIFPLENLTEEETKLLNLYSILPNLSVTKQTWKTLLGNTEDYWQELSTELNEKGLINQNGKAFEIHALLAEIVRYKNETELYADCYQAIINLIDKLNWRDNPSYNYENYKYTSIYIAITENIVSYCEEVFLKLGINFSSHKGTEIALLMERIGSFYKKMGNLNKELFFYKKSHKAYQVALKNSQEKLEFLNGLALSKQNLGQTYMSLGETTTALQFSMETVTMYEETLEKYSNSEHLIYSLAIAYQKVGEIYQHLTQLDKALEFFEKFNYLMNKLYTSYQDDINIKHAFAVSCEKLGTLYYNLKYYEKALFLLKERHKLGIELSASNPDNVDFKNGLAISCAVLGKVQISLGSIKKGHELLVKYNNLMVDLNENYGNNVNFRSGLADSYFALGEVQEAAKNYSKARYYYSYAQKFHKNLVKDFPQYVKFRNNLNWIEYRLKELEDK